MIKATFYQRTDRSYAGFAVRDHAGAADAGEDIVCAAVSALVTNTVNSLEKLTEDEFSVHIDEEDAVIEVSFSERPSEAADLLMRSLALGLTGVESEPSYQNYIDVIFEEVLS